MSTRAGRSAGNIVASLLPDVEIPDVSVTDFVFRRAAGDTPATLQNVKVA